MNEKELAERLEERGEMMLSKQDGKGFAIVARATGGIQKTTEAEALGRTAIAREET